jgi:hypothetical protein
MSSCKDRFEESIPARYGYNTLEVTKAASDTADLDPPFCTRVQNREVRYRLICGEGYNLRLEQSDKEIEDQIKLTAAKMSKNLHLSTAQSTCSLDGSETGIDENPTYSWDRNETEIWTTVARGHKIMSEVSRNIPPTPTPQIAEKHHLQLYFLAPWYEVVAISR